MRYQEFHGGWYVDALPTGERCVLFNGSGVDTHRGRLPLPAGESFGVLFLAITNVPNFAFAGQAHDTLNPAAHEWIEGTGWRALPPPSCGTNPLIYDNAGALHRSDCSIGSQGYRYVADDGRLVTGDQTIVREVSPGILIHEFTEALGLLIGQGHETGYGVRVWDGMVVRLLHPGSCFNIRVRHLGEAVTVAFYEVAPDGLSAHIFDFSLDELRALPVVHDVVNVPPPVNNPPPKEPLPVPAITFLTPPFPGLREQVVAALAAVRSSDDPQYWVEHIEEKTNGNDWQYWVDRINTGDGVGKAPVASGPVPVPLPPTAPTTPPPVEAPIDLMPLIAKLDDVRAAIVAADAHNVAKLDEIKVAFIKGTSELGKALIPLLAAGGGGLGGLLGGILNKK